MRTVIYTKIYGIQHSAKGWSAMYAYYFHKEHAEAKLKECIKWKKEKNSQINFRLVEIECIDRIAYNVED